MRIVSWTLLFAFATLLIAGCNSEGATAAPEDDAFQKQLADAAAKNKDKFPDSREKGKMPSTQTAEAKTGTPAADVKGGAPAPDAKGGAPAADSGKK